MIDLYPGIQDVLGDLQTAGYRLNIATAKPEPMVDRIIEHFDLGHFFTGVYGATLDESIRSTKTAVLAYGLDKAQADAADSLMIGDRDTDMQGGLNNHVQTLGVTYGFGSAEELKQAHAAAIVETPQAIPAGISQLMA